MSRCEDDVFSRRSPEQVARDVAHTQRMQEINDERDARETGRREFRASLARAQRLEAITPPPYLVDGADPEPMPPDVAELLGDMDDERAEEQREEWECAGSRDVGESCWCGRCEVTP